MTQLNQVISIEKNKKTQLNAEISELHHQTQKPELMNGLHRTYTPKTEEGETFPDETKLVQIIYLDAIKQVRERMQIVLDLVATKDWANTMARANVVVNGTIFLEDVPVPHLLYLEDQLHHLYTFVDKMVELDPGEAWKFDENSGQYRSEPVRTSKTKKLQKPITMFEPTEHHPGQAQLVTEDVVIGHWTTTKFSGAIPKPVKNAMLVRIRELEDAVKFARVQANSMEVLEKKVGRKIFDHIFSAAVGV